MQKFKETGLSVAQSGVHVDPLGKNSVLSTYARETLNTFWFKLPVLLHQKYLNE